MLAQYSVMESKFTCLSSKVHPGLLPVKDHVLFISASPVSQDTVQSRHFKNSVHECLTEKKMQLMMERFSSFLLNALFWSLDKFLILTFFTPFLKVCFKIYLEEKKWRKTIKCTFRILLGSVVVLVALGIKVVFREQRCSHSFIGQKA